MELRIVTIEDKKLVGKRIRMSLADNRTMELWQSFMSRVKEIQSKAGNHRYSVEIYDTIPDFSGFTPYTEFEKWTAVEVTDAHEIPDGLEALTLPGGLYAVFLYKGAANAFADIFRYIFGEWMPKSEYTVDNRPHFEIMGEKYRGNDPASEEEIWVPIRPKIIFKHV